MNVTKGLATNKTSDASDASHVAQHLEDQSLADWLQICLDYNHAVLYLHDDYLCKVANLDLDISPKILHLADPDKKSKTVLKKIANKNKLKHYHSDESISTIDIVNQNWTLNSLNNKEVDKLVGERLRVLGRAGRGSDITPKVSAKVWGDACGRCMFEGCGTKLITDSGARFGYLAHIVASDPKGPRGTVADSHRLSNDPKNIMLMCDEHHRLIDCFEPDKYTDTVLSSMRQAHCDRVDYYLSALTLPRVEAITLHANLAHVPTYFSESEFRDALLARGRAMNPRVTHYLRRTQRDERGTSAFWTNYLREHRLDIQNLVARFNTIHLNSTSELAIFPLHHIATLVLAGRIIGEASAVQVFQYHRDRKTWKWDTDALPQPEGSFYVDGLSNQQATEVLMTVELTAHVDQSLLPPNLLDRVSKNQVPWVRIITDHPNAGCISHPDDLTSFMRVARQAINHVQDVMRAKKVHFIGISPASTAFCFGQMLQAGHHPTYTIYDRANRDSYFEDAFSITGHEVVADTETIQIR